MHIAHFFKPFYQNTTYVLIDNFCPCFVYKLHFKPNVTHINMDKLWWNKPFLNQKAK